jgi:hypothetical protein
MAVVETNKNSLVSPSSSTLDFHLSELEEECARFVALTSALRSTWKGETREVIEGDLYASLFHIKYHVVPAIKEWDRLTEELPDDDEEDEETE